jgi:hypothetical protein
MRADDSGDVVELRVRRVEAVSPGVRVGSRVCAGDPLGVDWLGREIREETDSVIVTVDRYADFWLVGLRTDAHHSVRSPGVHRALTRSA